MADLYEVMDAYRKALWGKLDGEYAFDGSVLSYELSGKNDEDLIDEEVESFWSKAKSALSGQDGEYVGYLLLDARHGERAFEKARMPHGAELDRLAKSMGPQRLRLKVMLDDSDDADVSTVRQYGPAGTLRIPAGSMRSNALSTGSKVSLGVAALGFAGLAAYLLHTPKA